MPPAPGCRRGCGNRPSRTARHRSLPGSASCGRTCPSTHPPSTLHCTRRSTIFRWPPTANGSKVVTTGTRTG
eukprot:5552542-Prymnesium_polylepis.1